MSEKPITLSEDGQLLCPQCGKELVSSVTEYYEAVPVTMDLDSLCYSSNEGPEYSVEAEITCLYCNKTEGCYFSTETNGSVRIMHPALVCYVW